MIIINLNESQLFLSTFEATKLALDLESQLLTAANQICIADVPLTNTDGWRLLQTIDKIIEDDHNKHLVNWKVEGF